MVPRVRHDAGGSQPLTTARRRQQGPRRATSCAPTGLRRSSGGHVKRPNPLGLKCDTITSPRKLVNTFIQQMISDLLKRDKPIKVAINFKSWSTTGDISSEWG
jgi:hypothetical protein